MAIPGARAGALSGMTLLSLVTGTKHSVEAIWINFGGCTSVVQWVERAASLEGAAIDGIILNAFLAVAQIAGILSLVSQLLPRRAPPAGPARDTDSP